MPHIFEGCRIFVMMFVNARVYTMLVVVCPYAHTCLHKHKTVQSMNYKNIAEGRLHTVLHVNDTA